MECADFVVDHVDMMRLKPVFPQHAVKLASTVELFHLYRVVNDVATAADRDSLVISGDRKHLNVQRGAQAPVEAELFVAVVVPGVEGGEIQEAKVDGFFELVGVMTGQVYP